MQRLEDWDDLRFFLAVARTGGLSAASRELGVNQSTVSRRITQFEARLGARLFDRHARGYALTGVGEQTLAMATIVEDDVFALSRGVQGADQDLVGVVRVTTVDEVFEAIAPHLCDFHERYPGIILEVSSDLRTFSLSRREADVAIRPGQRPTEPDVVGRALVSLPRAAYAATEYLRGRKRPRRLDDLREHAMIGFTEGRAGARWLRELVPGEELEPVLRTNSMTAQAIAARAGLGVALLPRFVGDKAPGLERVFAIPDDNAAQLWLLNHADLRQTARVRAFVDFLSEAIVADRALYEGKRSPRGKSRKQ